MQLDWNPVLNDIIDLFAGLYLDADSARLMARRANLDPRRINFSKEPRLVWLSLVEEAHKQDKVLALLDAGEEDYPQVHIATLRQRLALPAQPAARGARLDSWRGPEQADATLEQVIGVQPTFLPVSFFETGIARARAVARLETPSGMASGFLYGDNLLVTNHHVLPTPQQAGLARVWMNYQRTPQGLDSEPADYGLDPRQVFVTSPARDGDDWTVVKVQGDPCAQWGRLDLEDTSIQVNDFANIIQHPGGMHKQIAMYHNLVVYADERRVQYLTDTMPGSSGSPVFDSQWRVVALHHSGGWLPEPGSKSVYFRNEGIAARALVRGLRENGLFSEPGQAED